MLAKGDEAQDCAICVSHLGDIRVIAESAGWSLPAMAAAFGAKALFHVVRRGDMVTVDAWSPKATCTLRRESLRPSPLRNEAAYAILDSAVYGKVSENDLVPQVRNS